MSGYMDKLVTVAISDVDNLSLSDKEYGGSWKKRGGIGAFMMLARKWDRLENTMPKYGFDIFKAAEKDPRKEGIIDDIRDLRRYLLLVEAELVATEVVESDRPRDTDLAAGGKLGLEGIME